MIKMLGRLVGPIPPEIPAPNTPEPGYLPTGVLENIFERLDDRDTAKLMGVSTNWRQAGGASRYSQLERVLTQFISARNQGKSIEIHELDQVRRSLLNYHGSIPLDKIAQVAKFLDHDHLALGEHNILRFISRLTQPEPEKIILAQSVRALAAADQDSELDRMLKAWGAGDREGLRLPARTLAATPPDKLKVDTLPMMTHGYNYFFPLDDGVAVGTRGEIKEFWQRKGNAWEVQPIPDELSKHIFCSLEILPDNRLAGSDRDSDKIMLMGRKHGQWSVQVFEDGPDSRPENDHKIQLLADGRMLCCSQDGKARIWRSPDESPQELSLEDGPILKAFALPDQRIVTLAYSALQIWNESEALWRSNFRLDFSPTEFKTTRHTEYSVFPDGKFLLFSSLNGLYMFSDESFQKVTEFELGRVKLVPIDNGLFATCQYLGGRISLWKSKSGQWIESYIDCPKTTSVPCALPDGQLVTTTRKGILIINPEDDRTTWSPFPEECGDFGTHRWGRHCLKVSSDGRLLCMRDNQWEPGSDLKILTPPAFCRLTMDRQ